MEKAIHSHKKNKANPQNVSHTTASFCGDYMAHNKNPTDKENRNRRATEVELVVCFITGKKILIFLP